MKLMRSAMFLSTILVAGGALANDGGPLRTANGVLVDAKGMTVYTYDKDQPGKSACVATCAQNWPPVMATEANPKAPYSVITREDGGKQLAHQGKPLYTFVKDKKEGDRSGDGVGGVWHVVPGK